MKKMVYQHNFVKDGLYKEKRTMNKLITFILLISSILFFSKCKKEKLQTDDAKIIGIDLENALPQLAVVIG